MEGVLVPEIWINVAQRTGIDELRLTTRDISDYHELMKHRLRLLDEHQITLSAIQEVIAAMGPYPDAPDFLAWLRERSQVIVLSDTFYEFASPLVKQLHHATLFCHSLEVENDRITGYRLRQEDSKREAVKALQQLNFKVISAGDSYNDTNMLTQADAGILINPPANVVEEFPQFPVVNSLGELRAAIEPLLESLAQ
jgi:phosphoserine/homoserine phosphotransferase